MMMRKQVTFVEDGKNREHMQHGNSRSAGSPHASRVLLHVDENGYQSSRPRKTLQYKPLPRGAAERQHLKTIHIPKAMMMAPFLQHPSLTTGQRRYLCSIASVYSTEHLRRQMRTHYLHALRTCAATGHRSAAKHRGAVVRGCPKDAPDHVPTAPNHAPKDVPNHAPTAPNHAPTAPSTAHSGGEGSASCPKTNALSGDQGAASTHPRTNTHSGGEGPASSSCHPSARNNAHREPHSGNTHPSARNNKHREPHSGNTHSDKLKLPQINNQHRNSTHASQNVRNHRKGKSNSSKGAKACGQQRDDLEENLSSLSLEEEMDIILH